MSQERDKTVSRFLSLVLRHDPSAACVSLDENGWVDIDDLLEGARKNGMVFTRDILDRVVETSDKKRFTISQDGARIRAAQGHSVSVDLGLAPVSPPDVLYHGTAERNLEPILTEGLRPGTRQFVHLSPDIATAISVGKRHGKPCVFRVEAFRAATAGQDFYLAENGVWLTDALAPEFLEPEEIP